MKRSFIVVVPVMGWRKEWEEKIRSLSFLSTMSSTAVKVKERFKLELKGNQNQSKLKRLVLPTWPQLTFMACIGYAFLHRKPFKIRQSQNQNQNRKMI